MNFGCAKAKTQDTEKKERRQNNITFSRQAEDDFRLRFSSRDTRILEGGSVFDIPMRTDLEECGGESDRCRVEK